LNSGPLNDLWEYNPSTGEWAWMAGSNVLPSCTASAACGASGVYGIEGMPSPSNTPGGRNSAVVWTDHTGNFWLFGGYGIDSSGNTGTLNDLWEFNPTTDEWTWEGGGNVLPACSTVKGCGASGTYGAEGTAASGNFPGSRSEGVGWTDSAGNLWLFGGSGFDSIGNEGNLNDLWEFNSADKQWTWISGNSTVPSSCSPYTSCGQPGVYGTSGTPSSTNVPGGRNGAVSWTDSTGNFWLFGGEVNYTYAYGTRGDMNDLWKFSPTSKEWTWMGGNNSPLQSCNGLVVCSPLPVYGLWQTPAAGNLPGARENAIAWVDSKGNAWLFGGYGLDSTGLLGDLNDLWEFDPGTNQWAWMSGSTLQGQRGSEGTQGIASFQTSPGGRNEAAGWTDGNGNLWLIGGYGFSSQESFVPTLGDFWEFQLNASGFPAAAEPTISPAGGTYTSVQSVTLSDSTPGAVIYYIINSNAPPTEYTGAIAVNSSEAIQAIAVASGYADSSAASASYVLSLPAPPAPTFNPPPGTYYGIQTVTISDATSYATIYYTTDGSTPTVNSNVYSGSFWVASTGTIKAIAVTSGGAISTMASGTFTILPVPPNTWTWVRGNPFAIDPTGTYGELGLALAQNYPGGRTAAASWTDANGNFWLFGGSGIDAIGNQGALNDLWEYRPGAQIQDGRWVWMGGSNTLSCTPQVAMTCPGQPGVYGTQGQPAAGNIPGGRMGAVTWVDGSGNLWLFGGLGGQLQTYAGSHGVETYFNDLWKFNPSTDQWTWISGGSAGNQFGVYGTMGSPATGNVPGGRYGAAGWVDHSGNLWMFGGDGIVNGYGSANTNQIANQISWVLDDLWMFNPSTNQWTWMGGSSTFPCNVTIDECSPPSGVYGTMGTPAAANFPGSRAYGATWADASGNFWLFGGSGYDSQGNWGQPNDLWKFSPTTNEWSWMNGSNTVPCGFNVPYQEDLCTNPPEVRGTLGVPASTNTPAGGLAAANWIDKQGNFWLFGSVDNLDTSGEFEGASSDVWVYLPAENQWAWMGGDSATSNCAWTDDIPIPENFECQGSQGVIGPEYQATTGNLPPSRAGAVGWTDPNGNFWLFSGEANQMINFNYYLQFGDFNDLWEFQPSATTLPLASSPVFSLLPGTYASGGPLVISNGMTNASIYYTTDGSTPTTSSTLYSGPIQVSTSETVQAMAAAPGYINSSVASATYTLLTAPPPPVFSLASGSYSSLQTLAISDANFAATIFYTTDGSQPSLKSTMYTAPISLSSSQTVAAFAYLRGMTVVGNIASVFTLGYFQSAVASATYTINLPQAATPTFSVPAGSYTSAQTVTISDITAGATIYYTTDGTTPTTQSTVYAGPISISASETVQAIATATGYSQSALATAAYTINRPPPSFTINGTAITVTSGATNGNTSTIILTPLGGFTGAVNLSCAITPSAASDPATCSVPASVTITGASAQTTTLTVNTTAATMARNQNRTLIWTSVGGSAFAILLCVGVPSRRRKWLSMLGVLLLSIVSIGGMSACGGGGGNGGGGGGASNAGTTAGTYTVTITGTSDATTEIGTITLTVQ
jgi:N-acetylneuraminic acid mutarotase